MYIVKYDDKVKGGTSKMCLIRINPSLKDDTGLLEHEKVHVRQWYMGLAFGLLLATVVYIIGYPNVAAIIALLGIVLKGILYTKVKTARMWMEVYAIRKQLEYGGTVEMHAQRLRDNYGLNLTLDKAKELIMPGNKKKTPRKTTDKTKKK